MYCITCDGNLGVKTSWPRDRESVQGVYIVAMLARMSPIDLPTRDLQVY